MELDQNLTMQIFEATQNEDGWNPVLEHFIELSGSIAVTITLRDQKSCQVIVDDAFESEFHSPFVAGMSTDAVENYVANLRAKDAWAEAQIIHRPIQPLLMSSVTPADELVDSEFGRWATAQGFNDTVVCQIGKTRRYWTALNFFFHNSGGGEERVVLEVAQTYLGVIKRAWALSRDLVRQREVETGIFDLVADLGRACCVVSLDGSVKARNQKFESLVASDLLRVVGQNQRLSISDHAQIPNSASTIFSRFPSHTSESEGVPLSISSKVFPVDPLYKGKKESEIILFFDVGAATSGSTPPKSRIDLLDPQEKSLFDHVFEGKTIEESGKLIGLKRARSFEIWSSIKQKTGIRNAHNLRN